MFAEVILFFLRLVTLYPDMRYTGDVDLEEFTAWFHKLAEVKPGQTGGFVWIS